MTQHQKSCNANKAEDEVSEKAVVTETTPKQIKFKTEADRVRYETALAADRARAAAPDAFVSVMGEDKRHRMVVTYCPETLETKKVKDIDNPSGFRVVESSEFKAYFGDVRHMDADARSGCIPVMNEHGMQVFDGPDPMWIRRREFYNQERQAAVNESNARLKESTEELNAMTAEGILETEDRAVSLQGEQL